MPGRTVQWRRTVPLLSDARKPGIGREMTPHVAAFARFSGPSFGCRSGADQPQGQVQLPLAQGERIGRRSGIGTDDRGDEPEIRAEPGFHRLGC